MLNLMKILLFVTNHPLNQRAKFSSILRFLRFQIATFVFNERILLRWIDESWFIISRGDTGISGNLYCGLMETKEMGFLLHYLSPDDFFVDIGANVGAYTILASKVRGAKSVSFEPVPATFAKLCEQVKLNDIAHLCEVKNVGVAHKTGTLNFTSDLDCQNKVDLMGDSATTINVDVTTLDNEFGSVGHTFVKLDVEGFENFVLEGGSSFFKSSNVNVLVVELNGSGEAFGVSDDILHGNICALGYTPISYDPFSRELKILSGFISGANMIYVKDVELAQKRVKMAEPVTIHTLNGRQI